MIIFDELEKLGENNHSIVSGNRLKQTAVPNQLSQPNKFYS